MCTYILCLVAVVGLPGFLDLKKVPIKRQFEDRGSYRIGIASDNSSRGVEAQLQLGGGLKDAYLDENKIFAVKQKVDEENTGTVDCEARETALP